MLGEITPFTFAPRIHTISLTLQLITSFTVSSGKIPLNCFAFNGVHWPTLRFGPQRRVLRFRFGGGCAVILCTKTARIKPCYFIAIICTLASARAHTHNRPACETVCIDPNLDSNVVGRRRDRAPTILTSARARARAKMHIRPQLGGSLHKTHSRGLSVLCGTTFDIASRMGFRTRVRSRINRCMHFNNFCAASTMRKKVEGPCPKRITPVRRVREQAPAPPTGASRPRARLGARYRTALRTSCGPTNRLSVKAFCAHGARRPLSKSGEWIKRARARARSHLTEAAGRANSARTLVHYVCVGVRD